jgi:Inhibitor of vertebrate lysozyme (Ivy)
MSKRATALASAGLVCLGALAARAGENRHAEFPTHYPKAFGLFERMAPDALLSLPFIGSLDNAADDGGVREITMDGKPLLRAFACMPHDCVGETLTVLFTPDQTRVVARARIVNSNLQASFVIMGEPTARELACLERASQIDFERHNRVC